MSLLSQFSICIILMSLGLFILQCRYPCITIHALDRSISDARGSLDRCYEEGVLATVWGKYEVDLLKCVHIEFLFFMKYPLVIIRVEDIASFLKEQSSRRMFRWLTMHAHIWH